MKRGTFVLILYLISLIIWSGAVAGVTLLFCVIGLVALLMDREDDNNKNKNKNN